MRRTAPLLAVILLSAALIPGANAETIELSESVVMRAAAVAETENGFVGSTASITISVATNGSGHIFLDTFPLTQVDMQGSARLAARVAAQVTGKDLDQHDLFFVVRSSAQQIGGPSAGAAMTVGAIAALSGWTVREDVLLTGTINPDGTVGPVGGIPQKAAAAKDVGVTRFLYPAGQEVAAIDESRVANMTTYCANDLQIECLPVDDVIDAVNLMTDHVIPREEVVGEVTGEGYLARLEPLGGELVADADEIHQEARAALDAAPESAAKSLLAERLAEAGRLLDRARTAVDNRTYYTAASLSFQSSIESHHVRESAEYLAATDGAAALSATLEESRTLVDATLRRIEAAPVTDTNTFEAVGAAQVRILEAEKRQASAQTLARAATQLQGVLDAIYQASYAAERAETAAWWLQLREGFPKGLDVEQEELADTARETITTSTEEVAYVEAVFQGAGIVSGRSAELLEDARELQETANEAWARSFYAGAMLNALEASVRASIALEIASFGGVVPEQKLLIAEENAARAIQGARARGVESMIAQSAYEFGRSPDGPPEVSDKLVFLGVARVTGNLAGLPGIFNAAQVPESRFQENAPVFKIEPIYVMAAFAVGIALGVGAGLSALMPRKEEP